jgi:hypothetical protein
MSEIAMSNVNVNVDRIAVRQMAEDGYRSGPLFEKNYMDTHPRRSPKESQDATREFVGRWLERVDATDAFRRLPNGDR